MDAKELIEQAVEEGMSKEKEFINAFSTALNGQGAKPIITIGTNKVAVGIRGVGSIEGVLEGVSHQRGDQGLRDRISIALANKGFQFRGDKLVLEPRGSNRMVMRITRTTLDPDFEHGLDRAERFAAGAFPR